MVKESDLNDENFLRILDLVIANIYWKDKEGRYLGCNKHALDQFGLSSVQEILGKNDYEAFGHFVDEDDIGRWIEIDQIALKQGVYDGEEHGTVRGKRFSYLSKKMAFFDDAGEVAGVFATSLDITDQKRLLELERKELAAQNDAEAEKLRFENEIQQIAIQEKEKFVTLARKVAHDINSPLAALKMLIPMCTELPESKRTLLKQVAEGIVDIANNLLSNYRKQNSKTISESEPRQGLLVSDLLSHLLSEKKMQYGDRSVLLETVIANDAQFSFINVQTTEFRRAISNLINNAVDALDNNGKVSIRLTSSPDTIVVEIADNGRGMTASMIEKIQGRQGFTEGKENGNGLGLQQVWDMLASNEGMMEVQSELGKGTSIKLSFSRASAAKWIAQEIHVLPNTIIVILDDDESIHNAWHLRFAALLNCHPNLRLHNFTSGRDALSFLTSLSAQEKNRIVFLSDYELLHQGRNGLQVVEESGVERAIVVTSYYSNPRIQEAANRLGIKILPKQMASVIPIHF